MNRKFMIFIFTIIGLCDPLLTMAAPKFSAICTLKSEHHYHRANSLDKKSKMIDEWTTQDDRSTSITIDYSGGEHLDIIDSRNTKPLKAPIIFDNGNTMFAIYLGKGGAGGTTRAYAVNFEANAIVSTTLKSGSFLSAKVEASADGNPDCVFKLR